MKKRNRQFILSVILVILFVGLILLCIYALIDDNAFNRKSWNEPSRPVFLSSNSNYIDLDLTNVFENNENVSENVNIHMNLTAEEPTTCTYSIVWSWSDTLIKENQYTKTESASNEFTISGVADNGDSFKEIQLNNYENNNFETLLYSSKIETESLIDVKWTFYLNFYRLDLNQSLHKDKHYIGKIGIKDVYCTRNNN